MLPAAFGTFGLKAVHRCSLYQGRNGVTKVLLLSAVRYVGDLGYQEEALGPFTKQEIFQHLKPNASRTHIFYLLAI